MNVKAKGYVLGVIAAATYGMNPLFALPLYEAGMNPDSVLFFRYLFAIPVLGAMIKLRGRDFKLKRKEILPLIIMGLLVALPCSKVRITWPPVVRRPYCSFTRLWWP